MEDSNILLYGNYRKHFEKLSAEQTQELMFMLFDFASGEEPTTDDFILEVIFDFMKDNMTIGSQRRISSIENGKKGGRPKGKKKYGQFVELDDNEYKEAKDVHGSKIDEAIKILDNYIGSTGKEYKSHLFPLKGWVKDKLKEMNKDNYQEPEFEKFEELVEVNDDLREYLGI